MNMAYSLMA